MMDVEQVKDALRRDHTIAADKDVTLRAVLDLWAESQDDLRRALDLLQRLRATAPTDVASDLSRFLRRHERLLLRRPAPPSEEPETVA